MSKSIKSKGRILCAVLLLVGLVFGARAYGAAVSYRTLEAAPATQSYPLQSGGYPAGIDSTTWATPSAPTLTNGNPKVAVLCEMGTASATATVKVGLYFKDTSGTYTFLGETTPEALGATATATATAGGSNPAYTDGSLYPANVIVFDTRGAPYYDVRITAISAGTLTAKKWVYGLQSQ